MKLAVVTVLVVSLWAATAQGAGSTHTPKRTTACLTAKHVLASPAPPRQVLPPPLTATAVVQISFALVSAQALDHGEIVFEPTAAKAKSVAAGWVAYSLEQASHVQGVDLSMIKIRIRDAFTVSGNTITVWENQPVKPASRRLVAGCLL